jgi:hypothetical protein
MNVSNEFTIPFKKNKRASRNPMVARPLGILILMTWYTKKNARSFGDIISTNNFPEFTGRLCPVKIMCFGIIEELKSKILKKYNRKRFC